MNDKKHYVDIAVRAAKRASDKVREKARLENRPLPMYIDGRIEFIVPTSAGKDDDNE
ncbi:MAG: hypothetical protein MJK04_37135 [Psychrosphaera sp.]|nr:hypothetical protein [Psychrosphaera sp.]